MTSPRFDPFDPQVITEPYSVYQRYADLGAIQRGCPSIPGHESTWYFFGFEEARQAFKAPLHKPLFNVDTSKDNRSQIWRHLSEWPLFQNPPIHTSRRALLADAFREHKMVELQQFIENEADQLLDIGLAKDSFEVQTEFSYPLAVKTICKAIGINCPDITWFKSRTKKLADVLDLGYVPDAYLPGMEALNDLISYLEAQIAAKHSHLGDDLISQLIKPLQNDTHPDYSSTLSLLTQMLFAGQETVADSIGISVHIFAQHPNQLTLLRNNPTLIDNAIKEILRFDSPVQFTGSRAASEDVYIGNTRIAAGETTIIALGACNHDKRRFNNPERFDIQRDLSGSELSFGQGIHYCIGVHLARMVLRIAVQKLVQRLPEKWVIKDATTWRNNNVLRGPSRLTLKINC